MAALSEFAKYVRPEVSGCPDIQIIDAILRAGIEFCKKTRIFKETVTVTTVIDQARYAINVTAGVLPEEVIAVNRDPYEDLIPSSFREFEDLNLNRFSGQPNYYYLDVDNSLVLGQIPNSVQSLSVTVRTRPAENATTLPDEMANRYKHQIASGAKSILMLMKNQPWSDLQYAGTHAGLFQSAIDEANLRDAKGAARKPLRTRAQHF